jgi:S1-C subfamily serine protease
MNDNFQDNPTNNFNPNLQGNNDFNDQNFSQNNNPQELQNNHNSPQNPFFNQQFIQPNQPNFVVQNNSGAEIQIEPNFQNPVTPSYNYKPNISSNPQLNYKQANHQSLHQDYNFQTNNTTPQAPENPYSSQETTNFYQPQSQDFNQPKPTENSEQIPPKKEIPSKSTTPSTKQPHYAKLSTVIIIAIVTLLISFLGTLLTSSMVSLLVSAPSSKKSQSTQTVVQEVTNTKVTNEESAIIDVAKNSRDSVVSVIISRNLSKLEKTNPLSKNQNSTVDSDKLVEIGAGSGFVVSEDGYIVTNRHVVENTTDDYTVVFDDGDTLTAQVLARDMLLDIAILKVSPNKPLKPISIGTSESLKVGQTAIAIGNSLGELSNTVSRGIISGLGRTIIASDSDGANSETLDEIIQTDASINEGNSGGPLLDINGNVIGVNVAKSQDGENIGFSIPIDSVKFVLDSVKTTGKIQRPFLGVQYTIITSSFANNNKLKVNYGALVSENIDSPAVSPNSPADKVGIKAGDIILEIDGQKINAQNDLKRIVQKKKVGDVVKLKILRDDKNLELGVKLEASPL